MVDLPRGPALAAVVQALRDQQAVDDRDFDLLFPREARKLARALWTPLQVAARASAWLAPTPRVRVLDVGAGVGKFCLAGALITRARFDGVEIDPQRVEVARALAREYRVNARFTCGDADAVDWRQYDAFYLYNPFVTVEAALAAATRLAATPSGTRIAVYNGIGCARPDGVDLEDSARLGASVLELWRRR